MVFREILNSFHTKKAQGEAAFTPWWQVPRQVRIDVQPSGVSLVGYDFSRKKIQKSVFQPTSSASLSEACGLAKALLADSKLLKAQTALAVDLSGDQNTFSSHTPSQTEGVTTPAQLDAMARNNPSKVKSLVNSDEDQKFLYGVFNGTAGRNKADIAGAQFRDFTMIVEPSIPKGVNLHRFMGQISAMDYLGQQPTYQALFSGDVLVCLVGTSKTYFLARKRDELIGLSATPRTTAKLDVRTFRDRAQNLGLGDKHNVMIVYLTKSNRDAEDVGKQANEITSAMGTELGVFVPDELIANDPRLAPFQGAETLPLGLFRHMEGT
jgi:hypothetical protein